MDQSKYDGKKYADVEDIVAAAEPHKEINGQVSSNEESTSWYGLTLARTKSISLLTKK